jgi:paraquat-inducible protein B
MSGKPNPTAIGAFVVGAIALLLGATLFFGGELLAARSGKFGAAVIFTSSVKGLDVGAPVTLRGVKIGEVTDIHVGFDERTGEFVIPVTISVNREDLGIAKDVATRTNLQMLIERGLRAQLKTQSLLTGLLYVDLVFKPESPPRYVDFETGEPQLPTAPTGLEAIMERMSEVDLQSIIQNADQTLRAVSSLLANPETQRVPANINATLTDVRTLIANTDRQVALLGARLDTLAGSADGTLGALRVQVKETGTRLDASLQTLDQTLASLRLTSDEAGYALSEQSPVFHELTRTAAELGRAGRALQALADALAREPESLLRGRSDRSDE